MNSQEIIDYVMNTSHNTNPIILKQMLDANGSGSGVTSWNDLTDKPFEEMDAFEPIVVPDDIDTSESFDLSAAMGANSGTFVFHKVNHEIVPGESYENCNLFYREMNHSGQGSSFTKLNISAFPSACSLFEYMYWHWSTTIDDIKEKLVKHQGYFLVVNSENSYGLPIGVYVCVLVRDTEMNLPLTISKKTVKTIDPKFLPNDYINNLIATALGGIENGTY